MEAPPTEAEQRVINEFCQLLDKSKHLFNGIRDLPQHGTRQWQGYFGRTFDVYTRLWKFQQQHSCDLMVKKLRYYARFVVVCLLLKKLKLVRDLVRELSRHVEDYIVSFDPDDQLEWTLILTEIKSFVEADNIVNIVDVDSSTVILSHRLTAYNTPPLEKGVPQCYTLHEVLIVGNCADQVKCTELSVDMFWMLQALEREPHEDMSAVDDAFTRAAGKENPHKYLLYKPTLGQIMLFLSSGFRELPQDGALLVYISADGSFIRDAHRRQQPSQSYDMGGVCMNSRKEPGANSGISLSAQEQNLNLRNPTAAPSPSGRETHCLYPGDLYTYIRKPLFLIVESGNSHVFLGLPNLFAQPFITFASPTHLPPFLQEQPKRGSLFTLFLHSPLTAFCFICNIREVSIALWDKCQSHIDRFSCDAGRLLVRSHAVGKKWAEFHRTKRCDWLVGFLCLDRAYIEFYGDDFLRLLILRFIFCHCTLRLHRSFRSNPAFHPHCHPPLLEKEILLHPTLTRSILDLASILDVMSAFRDIDETVC